MNKSNYFDLSFVNTNKDHLGNSTNEILQTRRRSSRFSTICVSVFAFDRARTNKGAVISVQNEGVWLDVYTHVDVFVYSWRSVYTCDLKYITKNDRSKQTSFDKIIVAEHDVIERSLSAVALKFPPRHRARYLIDYAWSIA